MSRSSSISDEVELWKLLNLRFEFVSAKFIPESDLKIHSHSIIEKTVHHCNQTPNLITGIYASKIDARTHQTHWHSTSTEQLMNVQRILSIQQRFKLQNQKSLWLTVYCLLMSKTADFWKFVTKKSLRSPIYPCYSDRTEKLAFMLVITCLQSFINSTYQWQLLL